MAVFGFKDVRFEVKTEALGSLNFHRVTPDYAARIEKADPQHDLPPDAFLSLLIVILGMRQDGRPILVEEAYALSAGERESFVHAFLNEHGEYYRERVIEERMSDLGEKVTRSFLGDRIVNPRHADEEPAVYLSRLYRDFATGVVTPEIRHVEAANAVVEENNDIFADSLLKNAALSESLGKSLAQMKMLESRGSEPPLAAMPADPVASLNPIEPKESVRPPEPVISPEPVLPPSFAPLDFAHNEINFGQRVGEAMPRLDEPHQATADSDPKQTLDMMRSLNDAVLQNLEQFAESAERNARAAKRARRLAVLALILALIVPGATIGYLAWIYGPAIRDLNKAFVDRSAQAAAEQKQQADTLKSLADQVRALRTAPPPPRLAD